MDKVRLYINYIMKFFQFILFKLYYKIIFLSNKQLTIKKMYEPIIENKIIINKELSDSLKRLSNENDEVIKSITSLQNEKKALELKISILSEYLVKK